MIVVPICAIPSRVIHLIVAAVPTGIKTGVWSVPCGVWSVPVRADPSVDVMVKEKEDIKIPTILEGEDRKSKFEEFTLYTALLP